MILVWVYALVITVVSFVPGEPDIHVDMKALDEFATQEECERKVTSVTRDMQLSYPGHTDYRLTCEKRHPAKKPEMERIF